MNKTAKTLTMTAALVLGVSLTGTVSAQTTTWDLSKDACDPNGLKPGQAGCSGATVTAWGNTGSGGTFVAAQITDQNSSGVGVTSGSNYDEINWDGKNHAIDNVGGTGYDQWGNKLNLGANTELVMVKFDTATMLSALRIGWSTGDADITVLRWDGTSKTPSTTAPDLKTMTTGTLTSLGWTTVASADVDSLGNEMKFNGGKYSSWWLISSYFGPTVGDDAKGNGLGVGNDYFKLLSFTGTMQSGGGSGGSVPEPGSLALAGLAIAGLVGAKRRRAQTV